MSKVIIIGGGAAGMFAALGAVDAGHQVTILEQNEKLGKKIYITGKGRCNLTNACETSEIFENIPRNAKFLYSAIYGYDNFRVIYQNSKISDVYDKTIEPMFEEIYNKLLYDLKNDIKSSPIFKHHIELIDYSNRFSGYEYTKNSDFNDIVTDYIASMTDDYFIDLYEYLFNKQAPVKYISYFDNV